MDLYLDEMWIIQIEDRSLNVIQWVLMIEETIDAAAKVLQGIA